MKACSFVNPVIPVHTDPLVFKQMLIPEHIAPSNLSWGLVIPEHAGSSPVLVVNKYFHCPKLVGHPFKGLEKHFH